MYTKSEAIVHKIKQDFTRIIVSIFNYVHTQVSQSAAKFIEISGKLRPTKLDGIIVNEKIDILHNPLIKCNLHSP